MAVPEGYHDMQSTAALSGLSPGVIRMWEARYGWPHPRRLPNGYRVYTPAQVEELRRVCQVVRAGTPIRQLIDADGNLALPRDPARRPTRPRLTRVSHEAGGSRVLDAMERLDAAPVLAALAAADRLHPYERALLWMNVAKALAEVAAQGYTFPGREKVEQALATSTRDAAVAADLIEKARQDVAQEVGCGHEVTDRVAASAR